MAQQQQQQQPAAPDNTAALQQQQLYPPPPPYFRLAEEGRLAPPPIIQGEYTQFGEIYTTEDGLPALQVRRLFEISSDGSIDIKGQLLALHRELLVNFLELLEVLIERPSGYARQVENVGLVLRNMVHLSNQIRPMQARATVLASLKQMIQSTRIAQENLGEAQMKADRALAEVMEIIKSEEAAAVREAVRTEKSSK